MNDEYFCNKCDKYFPISDLRQDEIEGTFCSYCGEDDISLFDDFTTCKEIAEKLNGMNYRDNILIDIDRQTDR